MGRFGKKVVKRDVPGKFRKYSDILWVKQGIGKTARAVPLYDSKEPQICETILKTKQKCDDVLFRRRLE